MDAIDLYQIHWPDPDEDIEEGWATMARLKKEGKVRNIGVSNFDVARMERAQAIAPITSLQPRYSLIHRDVEDAVLPYCGPENIGVIVYSPMASGLLTGAMTRERIAACPATIGGGGTPTSGAEALAQPRAGRGLASIGARHGRSPGEVAIAWTLRDPAVTGAIVGARNAKQVEGMMARPISA